MTENDVNVITAYPITRARARQRNKRVDIYELVNDPTIRIARNSNIAIVILA